MEPEGSSPYSQVPAICPYPEPTPYSVVVVVVVVLLLLLAISIHHLDYRHQIITVVIIITGSYFI